MRIVGALCDALRTYRELLQISLLNVTRFIRRTHTQG